VKIKREGGENYGGWKVGERENEKKLLFPLVLIHCGRWGLQLLTSKYFKIVTIFL